jgi:uncharacterized lipoprotein YajG
MKLILLTSACLLAGCGATMPTVQVKVPVPVACQETVPDRPTMPTEQFKAKPKLDELTKAALAELERREGYEVKLRTALEACTAPLTP